MDGYEIMHIYNYMCMDTHYICVHTCTHTHTTLEEFVPFCEHLGKPLAALNNTAVDMGLQYYSYPFL